MPDDIVDIGFSRKFARAAEMVFTPLSFVKWKLYIYQDIAHRLFGLNDAKIVAFCEHYYILMK